MQNQSNQRRSEQTTEKKSRKKKTSILQLLKDLDGHEFILSIPIEGRDASEYEESL